MAIHQATKNKIIDRHFKEHLPIREVAKITKKSSRDIILVLKTLESQEEKKIGRSITIIQKNWSEKRRHLIRMTKILLQILKLTNIFPKERDQYRRH
jgi:hypothetical protein